MAVYTVYYDASGTDRNLSRALVVAGSALHTSTTQRTGRPIWAASLLGEVVSRAARGKRLTSICTSRRGRGIGNG